MAQRRMFSLEVCDTDNFLDLPVSSQALYFHLGLRADDCGFVGSPKKITAMVNCSADDLKLLIAKGYVIPFDSGVCVIRDWKVNNYIQKDRYHETRYLAEKSMLIIGENQSYSLDTACIQLVSKMDTEVRLGKSKDSLELGEGSTPAANPPTPAQNRKKFVPPTLDEVTEYVRERGSRVDPQGFIDFYAAKGWLVGKSPMKDWKAACRNAEGWERWNRPQQTDRNRLRTDADYQDGSDFFGGSD